MNTNKTRCTLRADVYTEDAHEFLKVLQVSGLFGDNVSTEEASDDLEMKLGEALKAMEEQRGYPLDMDDIRLSWD